MSMNKKFRAQDLPWLLLGSPSNRSRHNNKDIKSFLSIKTNKVHHLILPATRGKTICGSSAGWLIMVDASLVVTLINPLTSALIQLPRITASKKIFIHKAVLSTDPECDPYNFVVMIIYGEKKQLAYYTPRSDSWRALEAAGYYYDDVISDGRTKLYAVNEYGKVVACKIDDLPDVKEIFMPFSFQGNKVYLVYVNGQLVVVFRSLRDHPVYGYETFRFSVFSLDVEREEKQEIGSFPGMALFLGHNHSTWLPAGDKKEVAESCIYFTDDYTAGGCSGSVNGGGHDLGRYNMEDGSFDRWQRCDFDASMCIGSRPIYITPFSLS